jgi:hypothetical protein
MGLVQKNNTKYYQYSMFTFLFFIYKFYDINLVGKNWLPRLRKRRKATNIFFLLGQVNIFLLPLVLFG